MNRSIIIPLAANGFGSRWNDTELKYCLRSIEKHLSGYGDIFLIGHEPKWVKDVFHIPATDEDRTWWKERNIFNKIMVACNDERVSEDFLFMNDDHFLLKDYVAGAFPYYFSGSLSDLYNRDDQYGASVRNTSMELAPEMRPTEYFDIHAPIVYNKERLYQLKQVDWNKKHGYCIKTLYCYYNVIDGVEYPDLKIAAPLSAQQVREAIAGRHWFSMDNKAREGGIGQVLEELYPKKSLYEK